MADEKGNESVYGENVALGDVREDRGIREETVEAHPQPTGDDAKFTSDAVDSADDVKTRGAEAIEGSEGVAADLENARERGAEDAGSGGMGREGTPRNANDAPQGEFTPLDETKPNTPG